ncbi:MAG: hypothetical protein KC635_12770, partial [Myxococcales bacterium]|nr:hypothetical protein [Myxococcales bacterium]
MRVSAVAWVVVLLSPCVSLVACLDSDSAPASSPRLALAVAPLELPGVADACYTLTVHDVAAADITPDALVWSRAGLCASRYGDGAGGLSFVGTCDASPDGRVNTVSLVLEGLCAEPGCDVADPEDAGRVAPSTWQNPCPEAAPCRLERACSANADTQVGFDLTVLREASQGFFDIAVSFDDIFCSA